MELTEAETIVRRMACHDFAWDTERAMEFALFRTYAVPAISGLLARTGEFTPPGMTFFARANKFSEVSISVTNSLELMRDSATPDS